MQVMSFNTNLSGDTLEMQTWFDANPTFDIHHVFAIATVVYVFYTDPGA